MSVSVIYQGGSSREVFSHCAIEADGGGIKR